SPGRPERGGGRVGAARAGSRSATAWPGRFRALGGVGGHVGAPHVNGRARLTHAISPLFEAISRTTALILLTAVVIRSAASLVALLGARISSSCALAMMTARGVLRAS